MNAQWNRRIGWLLLLSGFIAAAVLDPWSLTERDPEVWASSPRMAARHAQAVIIGMAFLQLALAHMLGRNSVSIRVQPLIVGLSFIGSLVYTIGFLLFVLWPAAAWLSVVGAVLNFTAFALLGLQRFRDKNAGLCRVLVWIFCFGTLLSALMAFFVIDPERFVPDYIGPIDGVRSRMLRLARAAVIALSLLTLLYVELLKRRENPHWLFRWAAIAMLIGAIGMPLILTAAALTAVEFKYLLGIPAEAMFLSVLAACCLAMRIARPLEIWGWALIAVSMAAGLLMGLYAFDGPLVSPGFLGDYNDYGRRLSRLVHAYCIVLGLVSICMARELDRLADAAASARFGVWLFVTGSCVTLGVVVLFSLTAIPVVLLGLGPGIVAVGLAFVLRVVLMQDSRNL